MAVSNLPTQPTHFFGRTAELAEFTALLQDPACRLLTLVGPGGIGKTRLALELADRVTPHFADGVYYVPLQALHKADNILSAIIASIPLHISSGEDPQQRLLDYLQAQHLLLVLDNFEHILAGIDLLSAILDHASQVKILVTSRESLKLREEWLRQIRGLDYPENGSTASQPYSGVQLFVERARRLRGDFVPDAHYSHIVRICQIVEGTPLALELAAGWIKSLSCREIAEELQQDWDILAARAPDAPERHRSMQAVFDHSWQLLTEDEQAGLRRMAVFRGGCTREAAQQVAGADLPLVAALVEKSLLRHDLDSGRYDMQELLRQYMQEQLENDR